ncbi:unnamed protein product [Sphenostylis stenocarpa]|uniref:Uncharacterized protein n=1 Tax=Sphenostylis stenocarpa TaxID=92480 RepID=A0AA86VIZ4_9FABA|nr:unnamed protein product [Sphenostylis stenocarpa]
MRIMCSHATTDVVAAVVAATAAAIAIVVVVVVVATTAIASSATHGIIFPGSNAGVVIHESRFCSPFTLLHTRVTVVEFPSELLSIPSLVVLKPLEQILSLYPAIERKVCGSFCVYSKYGLSFDDV